MTQHTFTPIHFDELMKRIREDWEALAEDEKWNEAQDVCAGLHDIWTDLHAQRMEYDAAAREEFGAIEKVAQWGTLWGKL